MATFSLCPPTLDICRTRNDTRRFTIQITDSAGTAIDVTGATAIELAVSNDEDGLVGTELFELTGAISGAATNGTFVFTISAVQADQTPDVYRYDAEFTDSAGEVQTFATGKWEVKPDVTNP